MKHHIILFGLLSSIAHAGDETSIVTDSSLGAKGVIIPAASERTGRWKVGTGLMWRRLGGTRVNHGASASQFRGLPLGVGDDSAIANREYDDGFVRIGTGTQLSGFTSYFGYPTAPSFSAGDLVFAKGGGVDIALPSTASDGDETVASPYIQLSYLVPVREDLEIGFGVNFALAGLDSQINQALAVSEVTTRDFFDVGGVVLPNQQYTGPISVAPTGSPLIPNRPIPGARQQTFTPNGSYPSRFKNNTDLFSLALGPELHWFPSEKASLGLSAGLVVNFADWDASSTLPSVSATNQIVDNLARSSGEEFLFGAFIKANIEIQLNGSWGIETFYRYDWNEDLEGRVGNTTFETDLSGWSAGLGATYRF